PNLQRRFENTESEWVKQRLHGCMSEQPCPACCGTRLKKEALCVRLHTLDGREAAVDCGPNRDTAVPAVLASRAVQEAWSAEVQSNQHGRDGRVTTKVAKNGKSAATLPKLPGYSIDDVSRMTVVNAKRFFESLRLSEEGTRIAEPIVREISAR